MYFCKTDFIENSTPILHKSVITLLTHQLKSIMYFSETLCVTFIVSNNIIGLKRVQEKEIIQLRTVECLWIDHQNSQQM